MIGWTREVIELANLALARFTDLNQSELKVLVAVTTGETAYCGPSRDDNHPHNNPDFADFWGLERDIRAALIRWLCVNRDAATLVDPRGVWIHAARISGQLDLSFVVVRFPLILNRCRITDAMTLRYAQIELLGLPGSLVPGLAADGMRVRGSLILRDGFRADGEVRLLGADIGGNLECGGGRFVKPDGYALNADGVKVTGDVFLQNGFSAEGEVRLPGAEIGGDLSVTNAELAVGSRLNAERATVKGGFFCRELRGNVKPVLDLSHASVGPIFDDRNSWPTTGNLDIDGFVYPRIADGPADAKSRLEWLARQPANQFTPQPYQQLAKVLREAGDNVGARRVLIAMENSRRKHGNLNSLSWFWRWVLRLTIGYGYRPWYALIWALVFVALGSGLFWRYSALITPSDKATYEQMHLSSGNCTAEAPGYYQAFSPVVYSLDSFLPIISFGQKDRWMPNAHCGSRLEPRWPRLAKLTSGWFTSGWLTTGWLLRLYLWFHIGFGWLLTTLFVAGLTPIVRSG